MIKSDIDLAKEILYNKNLKICIVKDSKVVFSSNDRGILPMYLAIKENLTLLENSSIADRVVGRAAAMLSVYSNVNAVFSDVISENAINLLTKNSIDVDYKKKVPFIKNRAKDDLCPVEKLSSNIDDNNYSLLIEKIEGFLTSIKVI